MHKDVNMQGTGSVSDGKKQDGMSGRKRKKWIIPAAVCCVAAIAVIAVRASGKRNDMQAMAVLEPETAEVERRTLIESVSATGKIASVESKTVTALVTGVEIKSVDVKVGDVVSEGDVLCVLDSSALEQNLTDAKTSLSSAQGKTQISVSSAQRSLEEAQASRNIELERANEDVAKAWNDYLEAVTDQEKAESEYNEAKNTTIGKNAELERSQKLLEKAQQRMDSASGSGGSSEYESGFNRTLESLAEYAQENGLTLKSNDIYLTADLSALTAESIVEGDAGENWETVRERLESFLGELRGWQSKYREAVSAESAYQEVKAEYESLQQEVSSWQQKYSEARQSESTSESAYENAVSTAKSKLEAYNQKVRSKEDTIRNNESTVNSKNDSLQNSVQDAAVSGLSDKQKIREYEKQIAACTVKAPRAGVVTSVGVEEGNSYTGGTIAVIEDAGDYEVTAEIDEYDIGKIKVGQKTVIKTNGTGDTEFEGKVKEIAPRATTSGSGSDVTYKVDISIDTPGDGLKLDMTAKLSVVLKSVENVLTVPSDALQEDDDGNYYVEVLRTDLADDGSQSGTDSVEDGSQPDKNSAKRGSESETGTDSKEDDDQTGSGTAKTSALTGFDAGEKSAIAEKEASKGGKTESKTENRTESMEAPEQQKPENKRNSGGMKIQGKEQAQMPQTEKITVQKGVESDYYVQIISDRIEEGMQVVVPSSNDQNIQDTMQQMGPMGGF